MTVDHPAFPPRASRPWVVAAVLWWAGIAVITTLGAEPSLEPLSPGPFRAHGVMATDVLPGRFGPWALIETGSSHILADLPEGAVAYRGDHVAIAGTAGGSPGVARREPYRGTVRATEFEVVAGPGSPLLQAGNALRARVIDAIQPVEPARALLAGFLVGDTGGLDELDIEAMRRAGLSHFTAVSGSNVALFLGLLFLASGPLSFGPKRRAVVGLVGLPIYAAATGFEPSVMRASVMAGVVLAGRLFDVVLEAWQLLALAVIALLAFDPALAASVGFQLSVAATAGVLIGSRWPVQPGRVRRALAVALGAQAAVAPLLVASFGGVPLLSPPVNLIAAPLVASATVLGAIGAMGIDPLLEAGVWLAGLVLGLARGVSSWPQVGWQGMTIVTGLALLYALVRRIRGPLALGIAIAVVAVMVGGGARPPDAGVVAFDVGQGDSLLLSGGDGRYALVDGGPDPVRLIERLGAYRVRGLELVVLTHVHADHAAGLSGLMGRIPIDRLWEVTDHHETPASTQLLAQLAAVGVPVDAPSPGDRYDLGDLDLVVLGPLRRYASPNDESIVLMVEGPARTMLLTGDVETAAQDDLVGFRADVLKVPHHGAATSDREWLQSIGADQAIISVGPNDFGHPADWVIHALQESGADVERTDRDGDIVVDLGRCETCRR